MANNHFWEQTPVCNLYLLIIGIPLGSDLLFFVQKTKILILSPSTNLSISSNLEFVMMTIERKGIYWVIPLPMSSQTIKKTDLIFYNQFIIDLFIYFTFFVCSTHFYILENLTFIKILTIIFFVHLVATTRVISPLFFADTTQLQSLLLLLPLLLILQLILLLILVLIFWLHKLWVWLLLILVTPHYY